jgi:hypothetical protein
MTTYSAQKVQIINSLGLSDDLKRKVIKDSFAGNDVKSTGNNFLYLEKIGYSIGNSGTKYLYVPAKDAKFTQITIPPPSLPTQPTEKWFDLVSASSRSEGGYTLLSSTFEAVILSSQHFDYIIQRISGYLQKFDKGTVIVSISEYIKSLKSVSVQTFIEHCEMVYCLLLKNCTSIASIDDATRLPH